MLQDQRVSKSKEKWEDLFIFSKNFFEMKNINEVDPDFDFTNYSMEVEVFKSEKLIVLGPKLFPIHAFKFSVFLIFA